MSRPLRGLGEGTDVQDGAGAESEGSAPERAGAPGPPLIKGQGVPAGRVVLFGLVEVVEEVAGQLADDVGVGHGGVEQLLARMLTR